MDYGIAYFLYLEATGKLPSKFPAMANFGQFKGQMNEPFL